MARTSPGGGTISFDDFFAAIGGQESGGNYGAINSRTGASGKYQIMPANVGPWSQKYLGRRITVEQFRSSPQLQEQLARAVLSDYFNRYGARGAAAAWYSGNPAKAGDYKRFRSNEPSVGEYVDQVLRRVGHTSNWGEVPPAGTQPLGAPSPATKPDYTYDTPQQTPAPPKMSDALATPTFSNLQAPTFDNLQGRMGDSSGRTEQQASAVPAGVTQPTGAPGGSDPMRDRVIAEAMRYIGTPYVWGGTSPKGFDCSGLIQYVYGKVAGLGLPRVSSDQANFGTRTSINQLRPGDLVATDNSSRNAGADHIAIYAGDGWIIEAPHAGASVRRRKLGANENYYGVALNI